MIPQADPGERAGDGLGLQRHHGNAVIERPLAAPESQGLQPRLIAAPISRGRIEAQDGAGVSSEDHVRTDAGILRPDLSFKRPWPWTLIEAGLIAAANAGVLMMR
jgi:hypothetical protein